MEHDVNALQVLAEREPVARLFPCSAMTCRTTCTPDFTCHNTDR